MYASCRIRRTRVGVWLVVFGFSGDNVERPDGALLVHDRPPLHIQPVGQLLTAPNAPGVWMTRKYLRSTFGALSN